MLLRSSTEAVALAQMQLTASTTLHVYFVLNASEGTIAHSVAHGFFWIAVV